MTDTNWLPEIENYPGPKYLALFRALNDAIRNKVLDEGQKLPTVRDLAWRLKVTPGTVARAYQMGTNEGFLEAVVGRGTFVASRTPAQVPSYFSVNRDSPIIDLRSPHLPEIGQGAEMAEAMRRIAGRIDADWIEYPSAEVDKRLRDAVAHWHSTRTGLAVSADDIAVAHGGLNAVNLVFQTCLRGERPVVLTEELAFPGFRRAARLMRADVVGVEMDEEGIRPEALVAACRRHGARVLCLTPEAQNPTTVRMGLNRRRQIAEIARNHDLQIIDDDCYSLPSPDLPAFRELLPEATWMVTSVSKSVSAGLRFGYLICPPDRAAQARLTAQHGTFGLSRPLNEICRDLYQSGAIDRLSARVSDVFAERLQVAVNTLGSHDLTWRAGVPFVWLRLPIGWRASSYTRAAEARGILIRSADDYAGPQDQAPHAVRIALDGGLPLNRFEAAMVTLSELLANPPGELLV